LTFAWNFAIKIKMDPSFRWDDDVCSEDIRALR